MLPVRYSKRAAGGTGGLEPRRNHTVYFDDVNHALPILARHLGGAVKVGSRQGEMTRERLMTHFELANPLNRYITVPGRRASLPAQIAETMWVLAGRNDIAWLQNYLPRAGEFSDDGETWRAGYGPRIRSWRAKEFTAGPGTGQSMYHERHIDQLRHVVSLLKDDPNTRRAVISLYDPAVDTAPGKDIACNNWLHFIARGGELHLHVATRSNDLWWGWSGINQFEWSVLLEIVAELTSLRVGQITYDITSLHLYEKHWERALEVANHGVNLTGPGQPFNGLASRQVNDLDIAIQWWFEAEEKLRNGAPNGDVVYTGVPLFDEWLDVLGWWWTGDDSLLPRLTDPVRAALMESPLTKKVHIYRNAYQMRDAIAETGQKMDAFLAKDAAKDAPEVRVSSDPFNAYVDALHREKGAAYGDSWKRRGEQVSILSNVYRKVDRLGQGETADETSADTAIDLLVYLIKYRWWLTEQSRNARREGEELGRWTITPPFNTRDRSDEFEQVLVTLEDLLDKGPAEPLDEVKVQTSIQLVRRSLDDNYDVSGDDSYKAQFLTDVIVVLAPVARHLWAKEQLSTAFKQAANNHAERNATRAWAGYGDGE